MQSTSNHGFYKPEHDDDILETITNVSHNFEKLDTLVDENAENIITYLIEGEEYPRGKRVWNHIPIIGDYVGWVNIRDGKFAPTWQERTEYKSGNLVSPDPNNGHIYECVESGVSGLSSPSFPTTSGAFMYDLGGAIGWIENYVFEIDDVVVPTNGNQQYYYRCIQSGTSSASEPNWSTSIGSIIIDGSVRWQTYKTARWREVGASCEFRHFGKIL